MLQVVRRPKRGDGAVCVVDPKGKRLKIPVWMLSPECAAIPITEKAHLSKEALLKLTSLLATRLTAADQIHDNLLQTVVDERGPAWCNPTSDLMNRTDIVVVPGRKGARVIDQWPAF
jgi:hypothetical protein